MPQPYDFDKCIYEVVPAQNEQQNGKGETQRPNYDEIDLQDFSNIISAIPRNYPYPYPYPQGQYPRQQDLRSLLQQEENPNDPDCTNSANAYNGQHYDYYNNQM